MITELEARTGKLYKNLEETFTYYVEDLTNPPSQSLRKAINAIAHKRDYVSAVVLPEGKIAWSTENANHINLAEAESIAYQHDLVARIEAMMFDEGQPITLQVYVLDTDTLTPIMGFMHPCLPEIARLNISKLNGFGRTEGLEHESLYSGMAADYSPPTREL